MLVGLDGVTGSVSRPSLGVVSGAGPAWADAFEPGVVRSSLLRGLPSATGGLVLGLPSALGAQQDEPTSTALCSTAWPGLSVVTAPGSTARAASALGRSDWGDAGGVAPRSFEEPGRVAGVLAAELCDSPLAERRRRSAAELRDEIRIP